MKKTLFIISFVFLMAGCSSHDEACEDVTLASEQIQQCQILQRKIVNAKGQPIIRTELERRYQQDCIDIRYYREGKQDAICGNKQNIEKVRKSAQQEAKQ